MACYHPIRAYRTATGEVLLAKEPPAATRDLQLPCGKCIGCKRAYAEGWALRGQLELDQHTSALFATLTYNPDNCPTTLEKHALQLFLKRLRRQSTEPIRFLACGEYGEQNGRPHYHAILYGLNLQHSDRIERAWTTKGTRWQPGIPLGFTEAVHASAATVGYVAGYVAKKYEQPDPPPNYDHVDPSTGEYIQAKRPRCRWPCCTSWQKPFLQMSRNPGIGGHARQWPESWRLFAVHNGHKMPVPRYYHDAWKEQATAQEKEDLDQEKQQLQQQKNPSTEYTRQAQEKMDTAKHNLAKQQRRL